MKLEYPIEWFEHSAEVEGIAEVGAGMPPNYRMTSRRPAGQGPRISLGEFVELWRRSKGWDAERLAREAKVDPEEVWEIESNPNCGPAPEAIYRLAGVIGVDGQKLLGFTGPAPKQAPRLREGAPRFVAGSEPVAALTEVERVTLEAILAALPTRD